MQFSTQIDYGLSFGADAERPILRLVPDACLRATPPLYCIYSSSGQGACFRTDDWQLALWIMSFAEPKAVADLVRGMPPEPRGRMLSLLEHLKDVGVLTGTGSASRKEPDIEHAATTEAVSAMMQAVYDLAGELRGLGPAVHEQMGGGDRLSLQHRVESLLTTLDGLKSELAQRRGPLVKRRLEALGVDADSRDLKVHLGCGGHELAGWVNIDNHPAPLAIDVRSGLPLPTGSARYVFLAHLLEHLFYPNEAYGLLSEIRRVLVPGGTVRIVVPDIERSLEAYVGEDRGWFAQRRERWAELPEDMTRLEGFLAYAGAGPNPRHLFEHHKFGYDYETLRASLERCGFVGVRRCRYQGSAHEALRVDHASSNASFTHAGESCSLFVEAATPVCGEGRRPV